MVEVCDESILRHWSPCFNTSQLPEIDQLHLRSHNFWLVLI